VIETETVIEIGKESLAAVFAIEDAIASVRKTGGENVSVAAPSYPRVCDLSSNLWELWIQLKRV